MALEDGGPELEWSLDTRSGAVRAYGHGPLTGEPQHVEPDDEACYRPVPSLASHQAWETRRGFAGTLDDEAPRERVLDALDGGGAFGRFRRVVDAAPGLTGRWHAFHDQRLHEEARPVVEDFDDLDIQLV